MTSALKIIAPAFSSSRPISNVSSHSSPSLPQLATRKTVSAQQQAPILEFIFSRRATFSLHGTAPKGLRKKRSWESWRKQLCSKGFTFLSSNFPKFSARGRKNEATKQFTAFRIPLANNNRAYLPDSRSVLGNGPVAGELAGMSDINNAHFQPFIPFPVDLSHPGLGIGIRGIIF